MHLLVHIVRLENYLGAEKLNFRGLRPTAIDRGCGSPNTSVGNERSKLGLLKRVIPWDV